MVLLKICCILHLFIVVGFVENKIKISSADFRIDM